jgi:single-stranded-DNA-specific exonuclease
LTPDFFQIIKKMEPYGPGNMRPVLLCQGISNRYEPRIVGKNHLKMTVTGDGLVMDAIAFNFGDRLQEVRESSNFSLAFSLDENTYNGRTTLQMKVKGVAT